MAFDNHSTSHPLHTEFHVARAFTLGAVDEDTALTLVVVEEDALRVDVEGEALEAFEFHYDWEGLF